MSTPKRPASVPHGDVTLSVVRHRQRDQRWYWRAKRGRKVEPWPEGLDRWMTVGEARTLPMGHFAAEPAPQTPDPEPERAPTVHDAIDALVTHRESFPGRARSTTRTDRWTARQIVGTPEQRTAFASSPIAQLDEVTVARWLAGLRTQGTKGRPEGKPLSANSRIKVKAMLMSAIQHGVSRGWWPPPGVEGPRIKQQREIPRWAPPESAVRAYLAWLQDHAPRGVWLITYLQAETGCRAHEVGGKRYQEGARWADLELDMEPAVWRVDGNTKTGARRIVLPRALGAVLRAERGRRLFDDGHVLLTPDRPPGTDAATWVNSYGRAYVVAMAEQGVLARRIRTHDLRHRWISEAVARGRDLKTISAQAGVSIETLIRDYTHTSDQRRAETAEAMSLGAVGLREVG